MNLGGSGDIFVTEICYEQYITIHMYGNSSSLERMASKTTAFEPIRCKPCRGQPKGAKPRI